MKPISCGGSQNSPGKEIKRAVPPLQPSPPSEDLVRKFILANGFPNWGSRLEEELRTELTAAGYRVTRCLCMSEHPVLRLRMKGPAGISLCAVRRHIRKAVKAIGYRVTEIMPVSVYRSGQVDGAIVVDAPVGEGRRPG